MCVFLHFYRNATVADASVKLSFSAIVSSSFFLISLSFHNLLLIYIHFPHFWLVIKDITKTEPNNGWCWPTTRDRVAGVEYGRVCGLCLIVFSWCKATAGIFAETESCSDRRFTFVPLVFLCWFLFVVVVGEPTVTTECE